MLASISPHLEWKNTYFIGMKWRLALRFQTGGVQAYSPEISVRRGTSRQPWDFRQEGYKQTALRFQTGGVQADSPEILDRATADLVDSRSSTFCIKVMHKKSLISALFSFVFSSFLNSEVCVLTYFIFFIFAWSTAQKVWKLMIVWNCHRDKHALTSLYLWSELLMTCCSIPKKEWSIG